MEMRQKSSEENRLFQEIEKHLLEDEEPSRYLEQLLQVKEFKEYPFELIYKLKGTEQSPTHHPEGDAWNHMLLVVDNAAKVKKSSKNPLVFMWAALLHDVGKPSTTKIRKGKVTAYDHDKEGAKLAREFLCYFIDKEDVINEVANLVRYHMHLLFVVKNLPFVDKKGLLKKTDINEVALLGYCDRMGRKNQDKQKIQADMKQFIKIMTK